MIILKVVGIIVIVIVALFLLTFLIYIRNWDMKLSAKLIPWLSKHYDRVKRDTKL